MSYPISEDELIKIGRDLLASSDEFSSVVNFMHQLPEQPPLPGDLANTVLTAVFGDVEKMPGLVRILADGLEKVVRKGNVVQLVNEEAESDPWQGYIVKKKHVVQFEIENIGGSVALKNVSGLSFVENGLEAALQKAVVKAPKLECTLKLGPIPVQRTVDIA
jgi:hypothetical protein